jgi:uncharacterized protein YggE
MSRYIGACFLAWLMLQSLGAASNVSAAEASLVRAPEIEVSGQKSVKIDATRAEFSIEVLTDAATADAAGAENATISKSVTQALQAAHLSNAEIVASRLTVRPRWTYDQQTQQQKRAGFEAANSIQVASKQLTRIGTYIDVALGAGATGVSSVNFSAEEREIDDARQQALKEALQKARREAETLAHAAGGELGDLLYITTGQGGRQESFGNLQQVVVTAQKMAGPASEVISTQLTISATVYAHWKLAGK